jgi:hypothetical protein
MREYDLSYLTTNPPGLGDVVHVQEPVQPSQAIVVQPAVAIDVHAGCMPSSAPEAGRSPPSSPASPARPAHSPARPTSPPCSTSPACSRAPVLSPRRLLLCRLL